MIQINCEKLFDDRSGGLLRSNRKSFIDKLTAIIESMPAMSIEERVNFILNDLSSEESTNKLVDLPPANPKSAEVSLAHREAGNKYFTSQGKRNIDKAFEEYTKSMAFAPIKSREYSLACANRSAVLFEYDLSSLPPSKFIDVKTKMKQLESLKEKIKKIDEITAADWKKTNQFLIRKNIQDQLEKYVAEFYYTYVEYPEAIAYITKFMEQLHKISEKPIFSIDQ
ncbi:hypothetical protein HCN44_008724 [Aphidius gifuensis]|uniref:Uncharacterized protein n=1 Tax=Aphidius gifuensis TaxID=684658 RepID=A0A835CRC2_APHGI|nr:hypothetical protein HCN44_008724 [Aphidius gifuensis]